MSEQSSSGGGSVVESTAPWAAEEAGSIGANAAYAANQSYQTTIDSALNNINQNYQSALTGLQPASQAGVQALDQINQYLGLDPYTPAVKPTAPTMPTLQSEEAKVTPQQADQYIIGNTLVGGYSNGYGGAYSDYLGNTSASGDGTQGTNAYSANGQIPGASSAGIIFNAGDNGGNELGGLGQFQSGATAGIAYNNLQNDLPAYQTAMQNYQLQSANYAQDQQWAQQYGTPLTAQQISDNVTNQPGYQAQLSQGISAINKSDTASGYLGSGTILQDLMNYGQNTLSTYYGNMLNRLGTIAEAGQSAANSEASLTNSLNSSIGTLETGAANSNANSIISGNSSLMQGLIAANPQYQTIGGSSSSSFSLGGAGSAVGAIGSLFSGGGA